MPQTKKIHPFKLSRKAIELRAIEMLKHTLGKDVDHRVFIDISKILNVFIDRKWIEYICSERLGRATSANGIKGRINGKFTKLPNQKPVIRIDKDILQGSPKYNFTLAHEIGHFVLHRNLLGKNGRINQTRVVPDTNQEFNYGREMASMSDLQWVEWQANEFAMMLICPNKELTKHIVKVQIELGIVRNRGFIYLNESNGSFADYCIIMKVLCSIYDVSPTLMWHRLKHLDFIRDLRKKKPTKQIYEILKEQKFRLSLK